MCVALKPGSPFQIHYLAALNGNPVLVFKVSDQKSSISECPNEIPITNAVALSFQKSSISECPNELNFNANECGYMMVAK